jgi:hypothetical protein
MSHYTINLHGLKLETSVSLSISEPSTAFSNGYSELDWFFIGGTDEIGETISKKSLDLICNEYINEIERAIWAQIEGRNHG